MVRAWAVGVIALVMMVLAGLSAVALAAGPGTGRPMPASRAAAKDADGMVEGVPVLRWGMGKECTFAGALEAALAPATGDGYERIMGETALAFRTRWFVGTQQHRWDGSAPVGELGGGPERAERTLGLKIESKWADTPAARKPLLARLCAEIDAGRPVLVYDNGKFDAAVAFGYIDGGKTILVRDYYLGDKPEVPAKKIGPWFCFVDPAGKALSTHDAALAGLKSALADWSRDEPAAGNGGKYYYGAAAFDAWTGDLRDFDPAKWDQQSPWRASWWGFDSLSDAREAAVKFLEDVQDDFKPAARDRLKKAVAIYREETALCGKTFGEKQAFMGPWTGRQQSEWDGEWREREAQTLEQMKAIETRAMAELRAAVAAEEHDQ